MKKKHIIIPRSRIFFDFENEKRFKLTKARLKKLRKLSFIDRNVIMQNRARKIQIEKSKKKK